MLRPFFSQLVLPQSSKLDHQEKGKIRFFIAIIKDSNLCAMTKLWYQWLKHEECGSPSWKLNIDLYMKRKQIGVCDLRCMTLLFFETVAFSQNLQRIEEWSHTVEHYDCCCWFNWFHSSIDILNILNMTLPTWYFLGKLFCHLWQRAYLVVYRLIRQTSGFLSFAQWGPL